MTLDDAVKHASKMQLTGHDAIALHVLVEASKRILKMKRPIRELAEALSSHMNQTDLLGGEPKTEE